MAAILLSDEQALSHEMGGLKNRDNLQYFDENENVEVDVDGICDSEMKLGETNRSNQKGTTSLIKNNYLSSRLDSSLLVTKTDDESTTTSTTTSFNERKDKMTITESFRNKHAKKVNINFSIEHILGKKSSNSRWFQHNHHITISDGQTKSEHLSSFSNLPVAKLNRELRPVYPVPHLPSISSPTFYNAAESCQKCGPFDHELGYIYTSHHHDEDEYPPPLFDWLNCTRYNPPKISSKSLESHFLI